MAGNQAGRRGHAPAQWPGVAGPWRRRSVRAALLALAGLLASTPAAHAWQLARIEPRVDNLPQLLCQCEERRDAALERNRQIDAWVAYQTAQGHDVGAQPARTPVPTCAAEPILASLAGTRGQGVWAIAAAADGALYATVNLPLPGLLVSTDGGHRWHYRHLFLTGFNIDRPTLLRGLDVRDGLLAVASENGVLLSTNDGRSFDTALAGKPFSAVAISPHDRGRIAAGGNGTSFLSDDGGRTWRDLGFHRFTATLRTGNPYLIDHITSLRFDPLLRDVAYVGTGSHLYRLALDGVAARWQAMEGGAGGRVLDDSTVYNIDFGSHLMISTCNGVYYLERQGADALAPQADVRWGKFRDAAFSNRGVGGPRGNLRAYFVSEDPDERGRVLIADFAALYEGKSDGVRMRWRRVDELPTYSPISGYPEYTAIAWTPKGDAVVGSRYRGIYVAERAAAPVVPVVPAVPAATAPTSATTPPVVTPTPAAPAEPAPPVASSAPGCVLR